MYVPCWRVHSYTVWNFIIQIITVLNLRYSVGTLQTCLLFKSFNCDMNLSPFELVFGEWCLWCSGLTLVAIVAAYISSSISSIDNDHFQNAGRQTGCFGVPSFPFPMILSLCLSLPLFSEGIEKQRSLPIVIFHPWRWTRFLLHVALEMPHLTSGWFCAQSTALCSFTQAAWRISVSLLTGWNPWTYSTASSGDEFVLLISCCM